MQMHEGLCGRVAQRVPQAFSTRVLGPVDDAGARGGCDERACAAYQITSRQAGSGRTAVLVDLGLAWGRVSGRRACGGARDHTYVVVVLSSSQAKSQQTAVGGNIQPERGGYGL